MQKNAWVTRQSWQGDPEPCHSIFCCMLASPVIKRCSLLTDKLLRLLSLISLGQPDVLERLDDCQAGGGLLVDKAVKEDQIQLEVD